MYPYSRERRDTMFSIEEINSIVGQITYKPNWDIQVHTKVGTDIPYIQIHVTDSIDTVTGEPCNWSSGKRYLSFHMCRQEIVGVVYGLIEAAEIHEMREWFRYKGASIYNPHLDPDALVKVARRAKNFNCRENAMSMEEK
tara:strand:+ start:5507 stop:5926 length:420 start_codon:yes stop_codon:yes gene_type:complete